MRIDGRIVIAGPTLWLPDGIDSATEAIAAGRLDEDTADDLGYTEVHTAKGLAAPELAVRAAEIALREAGTGPEDIGFLAHAFCYYQGHDYFSPAHFIADRLCARDAVPVGVFQLSNGGAAAVQLAAAQLLADPRTESALVTTADCFGEPGFDRWRGDYGVGYGDGATALVLRHADRSRRGDLNLLAINSATAAEFGTMMHAADRFAPAPRWIAGTVNARRNKKAYLKANGSEAFTKTQQEKLREVVINALADAGVEPDDPALRHVLLPRVARVVLEEAYIPTLAEITPARPVDLGTNTGHLGAGDLLASAAAVAGDAMLAPGEIAVLLSVGAGFSWSCAVVQSPAQ